MTRHPFAAIAVGSLAILAVGCSTPTGPTPVQGILAHRAAWQAQHLVNYSYTYEFYAFNALANQPLRLVVRQDTVRSVIVVATGDSIPPTYFPTIDALFDRALAAEQNGSLTGIAFDPARSYPTHLRYAALPDALSSQQASAVQPLP